MQTDLRAASLHTVGAADDRYIIDDLGKYANLIYRKRETRPRGAAGDPFILHRPKGKQDITHGLGERQAVQVCASHIAFL